MSEEGRAAAAEGAGAPEGTVVGYHPVRELLRSRPHEVAEILVGSQRRDKRRREIERLALRHSIAVRAASEGELTALAGGAAHNGFAARIGATGAASAPGAAAAAPSTVQAAASAPGLVVLLEDVQDPRNLGAILRVCEGAGVDRVLIRDRGSAPIGPAAVKASAGAASWVDVERFVNTARTVQQLQGEGFWVYGADENGAPPWTVDLTGPVVLCLGGEENGLRQRTREVCDGLVGLPERGRVASLNVATAAAALLYEIVRQRASAGSEMRSAGA